MKENAVRIYKHALAMIENPSGADIVEKNLVKETAIKTKKDLEYHFKTAPKYRNDPEIEELLGEKEKKKDGIQSKRQSKPSVHSD